MGRFLFRRRRSREELANCETLIWQKRCGNAAHLSKRNAQVGLIRREEFLICRLARAPKEHGATASRLEERLMTNLENHCANCGGRLGLVCHHHWGLRFCRKACKDSYLAKTAKDYARIRRWLGSRF